MKFQDSSSNGFISYKKCDARMQPRTHAPKAICPSTFSKLGALSAEDKLGWSVILITIAYETNQYSMPILSPHLSPATEIVKGADTGIKAATQLPYLSQLQKMATKNIK